jgi:hypothetical protein
MLSEELYNLNPELTYNSLPPEKLFIGVRIKNLYDERRICIQDTQGPSRYECSNGVKLYGILRDISNDHKSLVYKLKKQKIFDLIGYNLILQDYKLSCNDCYYNLNPPLYPIDNTHIIKYIPEFNFEDFICFNPEIPKFQAFASLNVFFSVPA